MDRLLAALLGATTADAVKKASSAIRAHGNAIVLPPNVRHPTLPLDLDVLHLPNEEDDEAPADVVHVIREIALRASMATILTSEEAAPYAAENRRLLEGALARFFEGWPAVRWSPWQMPASPSPSPTPNEPVAIEPYDPDDETALKVAFVDAESIVVATSSKFRVLDAATKEVLREWPSRGAELIGVADGQLLVRGAAPTGERIAPRELAIEATRRADEAVGSDRTEEERAAMFADAPEDEAELTDKLFALDLGSGKWSAAWRTLALLTEDPFSLPHAAQLVRNDGAFAIIPRDDGGDRGEPVLSSDLAYVWVDGALYSTATLSKKADVFLPADVADIEPRACARRADGRIATFEGVQVRIDGRLVLTLDEPPAFAVFDAPGERLATIDGDGEISLHRWD